MSHIPQKICDGSQQKQKNLFALCPNDMVEFRCYTRQVWSKLAGRLLTDEEIDEIIKSFGGFLDVLSNMEVKHNEEK